MECFKCDKCTKVFYTFLDREKHMIKVHYIISLNCEKCERPIYSLYEKNHKCYGEN